MNRTPHRPLSIGPLRAFEAVARRLSFSAAAEELFLTQPAISRQIKSLEDELGAPLFVRGTRKVELTGAGVQLQHLATHGRANAASVSSSIASHLPASSRTTPRAPTTSNARAVGASASSATRALRS